MRDPRRVGIRFLLVAAALAGATAVALAVGWVGIAELRGEARRLLPTRVAADLVDQVAAGMVVAGLLALAATVGAAGLLARVIVRQVEHLRATVARGGLPRSESLSLREASVLARAVRERLVADQEASRTLSQERDELAALLGAVGEGIVHLDGRGRILRANRAAVELLGLPDADRGHPYVAVVRQAELRRLLQRALAGEAVEPVELALEDRRVLVVVEPMDGTRRASGVVVVLIDLTELKRLETVRRDFVANASHELKTPLTSIRGYSETLVTDDPPPEIRKQFLRTIRENADRLQRIIDDLLDLSRLESGRWAPELEGVDVGRVAEEVWRQFAEVGARRRVAFEVDADPGSEVHADPLALRQILSNLVDNAIRYSPSGGRIRVRVGPPRRTPPPRRAAEGPRVRSEARSADRRGLVAVEVSDTGSGIPADALPRIFERFYRVDPARSREEGGTGLGLAIVKHLVESMGGSVEAESELGRGTTIRLLLPAGPPEPSSSRKGDATVTGS